MSKSRPTQLQMKYLVELMNKNPLLCAGKFTQTFTQKSAKQMWEVIAEQLDALPGAEKSWDKWKKTWQDTRSATKTKAAAIKRHIGGTGGGPTCPIQLNDIQQDALLLISPASVSGHVKSKESIVEFIYEISENDETLDIDDFFIEEVEIEYNENLSITAPKPIAANDKRPVIAPKPDDENLSITAPKPIAANDKRPIIAPKPDDENLSITAPKPIAANDKRSIIAPKPGIKTKMSTAARLAESNAAANILCDIAKKKFHLKAAYYEKKLKLMEDKNVIFKDLTKVLTTLSEKLPKL